MVNNKKGNNTKNSKNKKDNRKHSFNLNEIQNAKIIKVPIFWIILILLLGFLFYNMYSSNKPQSISTSQGMELIKAKKVKSVQITDQSNTVEMTLTEPFEDKGTNVKWTYISAQGSYISDLLKEYTPVDGYNGFVPTTSPLESILWTLLPFIVILLIFYFMMGNATKGLKGGANPFNFGNAKVKDKKNQNRVTFKDVAGIDEAVEELKEIRDFLKVPKKFVDMGAKIPKGVLLYGPPGTGKTLLAKAVAGEANVPIFSISGSEFVEMFVGVGASRVRDLFAKAKAASPSIIFVDEIDAVGRHRGGGVGGGHDEREQTLNQMLVEMDGFDSKTNVILIAATNRPDVLDPALLRPGRFDRQIAVAASDINGRFDILKIHSKGKHIDTDVDLWAVAKRTPGFTGADLANVLNEAALLAARLNKKAITNEIVDEAIDRVMAGPQRKALAITPEELRNTAYHEAGHAVVAGSLNYTDPVTKITILPRGRALGYTMVLPDRDKYSITRNELLDQLTYAIGGRVAEEIVFHDPTTGASNDIEKITKIAKKMIMEYGMSSKLGAVHYGRDEQEMFLARDISAGIQFSDNISEEIDREVRNLIENAHNDAWKILNRNRDVLDNVVKVLLVKETILEPEIRDLFKDLKKARKRAVWLSAENRKVSKLPPVKTVKKKYMK
jgi:cell division protease FtsH